MQMCGQQAKCASRLAVHKMHQKLLKIIAHTNSNNHLSNTATREMANGQGHFVLEPFNFKVNRGFNQRICYNGVRTGSSRLVASGALISTKFKPT